MSSCLTPEQLELEARAMLRKTTALDAGAAAHAAGCARCSSAIAELATFLGENPDLPHGEAHRASDHLDDYIDSLLTRRRSTPRTPRRAPRWLRWSLPVAAVFALGFGVRQVFFETSPDRGPSGILRGESSEEAARSAHLRIEGTAEDFRLIWTPVAEVEEYRVVWLGDDLAPLGSPRVVPPSRLSVRIDDVPDGATFLLVESVMRDGSTVQTAPVPIPTEPTP